MRLIFRIEPIDKRRLPGPTPKKVSVTDGPFAETKELVLGSTRGSQWEDPWCDPVR